MAIIFTQVREMQHIWHWLFTNSLKSVLNDLEKINRNFSRILLNKFICKYSVFNQQKNLTLKFTDLFIVKWGKNVCSLKNEYKKAICIFTYQAKIKLLWHKNSKRLVCSISFLYVVLNLVNWSISFVLSTSLLLLLSN